MFHPVNTATTSSSGNTMSRWPPQPFPVQANFDLFGPYGNSHHLRPYLTSPRAVAAGVMDCLIQSADTTRAPFFDDWPLQVANTVSFTEEGGQTTVALHGGPICATPAERSRFAENFESMAQGFGGTFAQLEAYLLLKK